MNLKKSLVCIIVVLAVCAVIGISLFNRPHLPKGNLIIRDNSGETMAYYSVDDKELNLTDVEFSDYCETVIAETLVILQDDFKGISREKLLNSNISIETNFCEKTFNCLKTAMDNVDFSDGKSAEAVVTDINGRIIASAARNGEEREITYPHKLGSAIKPLSVYAPALRSGDINWATMIEDSPIKTKGLNQNGDWPANYEGVYSHRNISLKQAIAKSVNTAAVKVMDMMGATKASDFLEELEIKLPYEKRLAAGQEYREIYGCLALGELKDGVTAQQVAAAYGIFASGGKFTEGYTVKEIKNGKKILYRAEPETKSVLDESDSEIMNLLLRGVVSDEGTAPNAQIEGLKIGGKTGTSQGYKDNWFIGFSPDYVCAVWYGYEKAIEERGENAAIKIFADAFSGFEHKTADFPHSEETVELKYCVYSGMQAAEGCNVTAEGYFNKKNLPELCTRHREG